jgi:hypothetical protein
MRRNKWHPNARTRVARRHPNLDPPPSTPRSGSRTWSVAKACNGILCGLVSVTAGCATIPPQLALVTGVVGALVYMGSSRFVLVLLKVRHKQAGRLTPHPAVILIASFQKCILAAALRLRKLKWNAFPHKNSREVQGDQESLEGVDIQVGGHKQPGSHLITPRRWTTRSTPIPIHVGGPTST